MLVDHFSLDHNKPGSTQLAVALGIALGPGLADNFLMTMCDAVLFGLPCICQSLCNCILVVQLVFLVTLLPPTAVSCFSLCFW